MPEEENRRSLKDLNASSAAQAAEIAALKEKARQESARLASLEVSLGTREKAIARQRDGIAALTERSRILQHGLDTIEAAFRKLDDAPSIRFVVYTARRFGLVSRNPRRCVEAIRATFSATRKAIKRLNQASLEAGREMRSDLSPARPKPFLKSSPNEADGRRMNELAVAHRIVAAGRNAITLPLAGFAEGGAISIIIRSHSNEGNLSALLNSFLETNTLPAVEIFVVCGALDESGSAVVHSFQDRLKIKILELAREESFAAAINRAAQMAGSPYLLFLSDRIVFRENVVPTLLRCLQDRKTGIAGLRLIFPSTEPALPEGLQHAGIKFQLASTDFMYRPFVVGATSFVTETPRVVEKFPAVAMAVAVCRRRDFLALGGLADGYGEHYGAVDLSLSFRRALGLRSVAANQLACAQEARVAEEMPPPFEPAGPEAQRLAGRHGWYLRRRILADRMAGRLFYSDEPLTVAFAVTDTTPTTTAGDFFTGRELAEACANEFGWHIRYLSQAQDWYDLEGADVLIVLVEAYELSKIRNAKPDLVTVAWMRNWFEEWVAGADFDRYDLFLCSSQKAARWLREKHGKAAWVFPLATNLRRFGGAQAQSHLSSDYCFTGSHWQFEREIETALQPQLLEGYQFAIFGSGWEGHPVLGPYAYGFLPYAEMPHVYASARVVVDDANHVTKEWGSVNSRVFDALAAGALVITNGAVGAAEIFDRELPVYRSAEELQSLVRRYLDNETERRALLDRLRERVVAGHTYRHRARTLKRILMTRARRGYRIAFKIDDAVSGEKESSREFDLAQGLGRALAEEGHSFRIDSFDEWDRGESLGDDVVIVLPGTRRYRPKLDQINLIWDSHHPAQARGDEEEEGFDLVLSRSSPAAVLLEKIRGIDARRSGSDGLLAHDLTVSIRSGR